MFIPMQRAFVVSGRNARSTQELQDAIRESAQGLRTPQEIEQGLEENNRQLMQELGCFGNIEDNK